MSERLVEYFRAGNVPRIDRESGVLYGVKILGTASRNRRSYPVATLRGAVPLYENAKVNLDHPDGGPLEPRRYTDRFGVVRNVVLREDEGLFADFHFNPRHPIAEQLLWDAEHAPENVGFSHNVEAVVERSDGEAVVREILSVRSVDLVADPATTSGLFESLENRSETEDLVEELRERLALYESLTAQENARFFASLYGLTGQKLKRALPQVRFCHKRRRSFGFVFFRIRSRR